MRTSALLLLALLVACGGASADEPDPVAATEGGERGFEWGTPIGEDLWVGGQPTAAELEAAAAAGVTTVISLRTEGEPGSEGERETVEGAGMTFVSIPVPGAEGLTVDNARALDEALDASGDAILHCGSGNRAGSLLGLRAFVTEGATGDEAMSLASEAGMSRLTEALRSKLGELCQDTPERCPSAP